jgi:hypothetical protein
MRKSQLKKRDKFRHVTLMQLRKIQDPLVTITDSMGHQITLNLAKHILLKRPYKNLEYQRELIRRIGRYAQEGEKNANTRSS